MVKKELVDFKLRIGEECLPARTPFSLCSLLSGRSAEEVTVETDFSLLSSEIGSKHHYIILYNVRAPFSVYFNGEKMCDALTDEEKIFVDLKDKPTVGENTLSLHFLGGKETLAAGIYGRVEYVRFDNAIIEGITVNQRIDGGVVYLGLGLSALGESENVRAVATLISASGQIYYGGITRGKGSIVIKDPLYWWPKGLGVQNLYRLTVNLYGESEVEDTLETRIGIRKISTPINPASSHLEVNGAPFLPMGAVYHPINENTPTSYSGKLKGIITHAAMAGFNAIVVPASVKAPDLLYELCDLNGIVVIREFKGESDEDYSELSRLSRHPSLGFVDLACGADGAICAAEKMQRIRPDLEFTMLERLPTYPAAESLPTRKTYEKLLPRGERNLFSETALELGGGKAIKLLSEISEEYLYPSSISEASYLSGLVASDKISRAVLRARLNIDGGRAVFDSLTDDSAFISGASVDMGCRRKALQYKAEKLFQPLAVFAEREGYSVGFSVSNERRLAFIGELELKISDNKNRVIYKEIVDCQVAKGTSKKICTRDLSEYIEGHENEYYLEYYIKEGLGIASRGTMIFTSPKSFSYLDPHIKCDVVGRDKRYSLTLTADAYAGAVEVYFADHDVLLYENYVDLTQNSPYKISFTLLSGEDSSYALARSVKVRSLYDVKSAE